MFNIPPRSVMTLTFVYLTTATAGNAVDEDNRIEGRWLTQDREGIVNIHELHSGEIEGRIVDGRDPDRRDANNPDPASRDDLLRGKVILSGLRHEESGQWVDGTIYDPDNGKTYRCTAELSGENILKIRGYVGSPLFGRTEVWTRLPGSREVGP